MDSVLIDYLRSGRAWVLVGSGPSIQTGQPSWRQLAETALGSLREKRPDLKSDHCDVLIEAGRYAELFDQVENVLGWPDLLHVLRARFKRETKSVGRSVYDLILRWPVSVYLTTNYDDEIQRHLAKLRLSFKEYTNSEDHFGELTPTTSNAIFKLHGDLRTEQGLILTEAQYRQIEHGAAWQYWRTKLTSVFQMVPVVIVGHSLTDPHVRHVLEAAKKGAGVTQPVVWIAPEVPLPERRRYLEEYRIRVIGYDNRDKRHSKLLTLLQSVTSFVPPRESIHIRRSIEEAVAGSSVQDEPGATGLFVFSKLASQPEFEERRVDVLLGAFESVIPSLREPFSLSQALIEAGWPAEVAISDEMLAKVQAKAETLQLIENSGNGWRLGPTALEARRSHKFEFDHLRDGFRTSLKLRIERSYPDISELDVNELVDSIESSLIGYFKAGGLSLASTLFGAHAISPVPRSIIRFINEASAKFPDYARRQAFFTVSVEIFVSPEQADRNYIGRLVQGYLAFQMLGVFGDGARERLAHATQTVWLVDSDLQIPAVALGAVMQPAVLSTIMRLRKLGVHLFATESLFNETYSHLYFAMSIVDKYGIDSPNFYAAMKGDSPYRNSNQFLEGFSNWRQATGNSDWAAYLYAAFKEHRPSGRTVRRRVEEIGIKVVEFGAWPGYAPEDLNTRIEYEGKIADMRLESTASNGEEVAPEMVDAAVRKALPEAEAYLIVLRERQGHYYILSDPGDFSDAWFVSHTSILNALGENERVTWQPEAFMAFADTLAPASSDSSADHAFDSMVWRIAESGMSVLDERIVGTVLGTRVEETLLNLPEQRAEYRRTLAEKYGESPEAVMARVPPTRRPLAAVQLANELAQAEAARRQQAERSAAEALRVATTRAEEALRRATAAERRLSELEVLARKLDRRKSKAKSRARKRPKAARSRTKGR